MKLSKRFFSASPVRFFLCLLIYIYAEIIYRTIRWQKIGKDSLSEHVQTHQKAILVFWHGRILMVPCFSPRHHSYHAIISSHNDGMYISRFLRFFRITTIWGSTSKGGMSALRKAAAALKNNDIIAITPDGPRGPRMRLNSNLIALSKQLSAPILPITFSVSHAKIFNSWDRFMLPLPFGRGTIIYGKPIHISANADKKTMEKAGKTLENALNSMTRQADEKVGIAPVKPEPIQK